MVGRQAIAPSAGDRDARPPRPLPAARSAGASMTKPSNANATGAIAAGVALPRAGRRTDRYADATRSPMRAERCGLAAPMDRREQRSRPLAVADHDPQNARAMRGGDPREAAVGEAERRGVAGVHLDEGLRQVGAEARARPGARHGVPLVAHAAGIEAKRKPRREVCAFSAGGSTAQRSALCDRA